MDDIVRILVVMAAIAWIAFRNYPGKGKNRKKVSRKPEKTPAQALAEAGIPMPGNNEKPVRRHAGDKWNTRKKHEKSGGRKTPEQVHKDRGQPSSSGTPDRKIRITGREEARRAFIYSEIFNRKY